MTKFMGWTIRGGYSYRAMYSKCGGRSAAHFRWCSPRRIAAPNIPTISRRLAPRSADPPPFRGQFCRRDFRFRARAWRAARRGPVPARLSRRQSRAVGTRPGDVLGCAAELRQHPFAPGADGTRHDRPGRRERRGDLCPQTALRRARTRVETLYRPYHPALAELVLDTDAAFGGCLLIDCHSMPSAASEAGGPERGRFRSRRLPRQRPARPRSSRRRDRS